MAEQEKILDMKCWQESCIVSPKTPADLGDPWSESYVSMIQARAGNCTESKV